MADFNMTREEAIKFLEETSFGGKILGDKNLVAVCDLAISAIRGQEERRWIPVTDRLPDENNRWVLCLCVSSAMEVLKFDYTMWNWNAQYPGRCYMENYVTHWMPLPKPPKGE